MSKIDDLRDDVDDLKRRAKELEERLGIQERKPPAVLPMPYPYPVPAPYPVPYYPSPYVPPMRDWMPSPWKYEPVSPYRVSWNDNTFRNQVTCHN